MNDLLHPQANPNEQAQANHWGWFLPGLGALFLPCSRSYSPLLLSCSCCCLSTDLISWTAAAATLRVSQCAAHSLTHSLHLSLSFTLCLAQGLARLLWEGVHCFWCLMTTTTMATTAMATCKRPNDGVNEKFALETDDHMRLHCGMRMQRLLTENRRAALRYFN